MPPPLLHRTANPWLDFLPAHTASSLATELNDELEAYCATSPSLDAGPKPLRRLYGFGLLPLVPGVPIETIVDTVKQIASLPHLRGLIMGTRALGNGLDDSTLGPVWEAIETAKLVVFLHPHYGLGAGAKEAWGDLANGHVLSLALGFPMETTIVSLKLLTTEGIPYYTSHLTPLRPIQIRQSLDSSSRVSSIAIRTSASCWHTPGAVYRSFPQDSRHASSTILS